MTRHIYLDNNSTTKVDNRVLEEMLPFFSDAYGNAASNHEFGVGINQRVKESREYLANLVGAEPSEIIFTSGATEAINIALKGVLEINSARRAHIISVTTEHPAVLDTLTFLEKNENVEVSLLKVDSDGKINIEELRRSLRPETVLVCVMLANNETGVIHPIKEIAQIVHSHGTLFMTDATQAVGKIQINVDDLGIDLMAISGHKFYGPKGIGALFVRGRKPNKVKLPTFIHGGGHEKGVRSGTLNVPGIVGLGKAAQFAQLEMMKIQKQVGDLRDKLESGLLIIKDSYINGDKSNRLYNTTNICFQGADADALMVNFKNIMVSNGSACTSTLVEPSHVLKAMGRSDQEAYSCLRFSVGKYNTIDEIETVITEVKRAVNNLRAMNM